MWSYRWRRRCGVKVCALRTKEPVGVETKREKVAADGNVFVSKTVVLGTKKTGQISGPVFGQICVANMKGIFHSDLIRRVLARDRKQARFWHKFFRFWNLVVTKNGHKIQLGACLLPVVQLLDRQGDRNRETTIVYKFGRVPHPRVLHTPAR